GETSTYGVNDTIGELYGSDKFTNGKLTFQINGADITLNETDSVEDMIKAFNNSGAGVTIGYDKLGNKFTLASSKEGENNNITFSAEAEAFLESDAIGFKIDQNTALTQAEKDLGLHKEGKDAIFMLNGVTTTRESNSFSYEGITFKLNQTTAVGEEIEINIEKDNENTKQLLKDFVSAYNELIDGLNGMVNEKRAKSAGSYYEPLTSEEKKSLSEKEVEDWEKEAKKGILNRDSLLSEITSAMRDQLYQSVTLSDGSKLNLTQIGIETSSDYKDQGKLIFDEEKFDEAVEKYGDKITELFTKGVARSDEMSAKDRQAQSGLGVRLNNIMENAIGTKGSLAEKAGIKGGFTEFQNDMLDDLRQQSEKISEMMVYLVNKENDYYMMFSRLEAAMSQSDSQMSYIQSVLGM
ncbi:MAG: flagellar filament capping protein FliD, partial [Clostridiales bacterium]|nr:flagellar filament capping protein FliD [Clostridiales bacterium]